MASSRLSRTRKASVESSASSNIDVMPAPAALRAADSAAASSAAASTPATSVSGRLSMLSSSALASSAERPAGRLKRKRSSMLTSSVRSEANAPQSPPASKPSGGDVKSSLLLLLERTRAKKSQSPKQSKVLRELDLGKKGILDEMDLDEEYEAPPPRASKKMKTDTLPVPKPVTGPLQKTSSGNKVKKWLPDALYVGQEADSNLIPVNLQKPRPESSIHPGGGDGIASSSTAATVAKNSLVKLPMFDYLDRERDFVIPYDVFAPSAKKKGDEKPKDWYKLNRNRLVGEAKDLWEKQDRLPASACVCVRPPPGELGCGDDCLNRVMQYECNEDNCVFSAAFCSNRAFAELQARTKKGGLFDVGVEVIKTENRGFGVRACRSFAPGQIIMEYTGEIISEGECQRRMREDYKDKQCYYLMELERNLVIDGTKGSMARFINHSCEPNCEVRMVKVNGTPRMGVFAGDAGVATGEELSYDYNYDNFGDTQQQCYCGASSCRGYLSKRLNAVEQKKLAKEVQEQQRKAAEEALKIVQEEQRKKSIKTARGSGWKGWVAVDDADVKEELKREKKAKEDAEKNSSRALRLAARRV